MSFYTDKNVLVTGASGLLGSHLVALLLQKNANVRIVLHHRDIPKELVKKRIDILHGDLQDKTFVKKAVKNIDYVFHLAVSTGGIGKTSTKPATTLTPNLTMDGNILDASKEEKIERLLYSSCACIYPNITKDLSEDDAWTSEPPKVHASISWAKRMGELQSISYYKEHNMKIAIVRPSNSYGPYDNFDPETAHVIGALMMKAIQKKDPFIIWGDGQSIREFIYAEDAAKGMLLAMEKYCVADPINLAGGESTTIEELAKTIIDICNYEPKIIFDKKKPSGQLRRVLINEKAKNVLNFHPQTSLKEGLQKTMSWLVMNQK